MYTFIPQRVLNNSLSAVKSSVQYYSVPAVKESKQSKTVEYPPILDLSFPARRRRRHEQVHEKIKNVQTVEEKAIAINMPRYYGWHAFQFEENIVRYNSLPTVQFITKTHVMKEHGLPLHYDNIIPSEELDSLVKSIENQIQDSIYFEYLVRRREHEISKEDSYDVNAKETRIASGVAYQVNRILLANLSLKFPHLFETQIDFEPRREAFWNCDGLNISPKTLARRKGQLAWGENINLPMDNRIRYFGNPILQLRHQLPLKEIIPFDESDNPDFDVPECRFDPRAIGYSVNQQSATNIPGFWPGDSAEFGFLSYHNQDCLLFRPNHCDDEKEALLSQAILASYSWLYPQACYQGFSTFNDITYPLTNQMITTNGQIWSFFTYQLNTILQVDGVDRNSRRNICWATEPIKLFENIEEGKIHGFNNEVVKNLIKFYINPPEERVNVNLKPYLGDSVKTIADIPDTEEKKRIWLEEIYKHLMTRKPRHRLVPEIYDWQKIYLIRFNTRPIEKKREPFQFGENPVLNRRLNEHQPRYVPKCFRGNPIHRTNKMKGKWENTYYPEV